VVFEKCFVGFKLSEEAQFVIEACLQAMSSQATTFIAVINELNRNKGAGGEMFYIHLDTDRELGGEPPFEFKGVCFEYDSDYSVTSRHDAELILQRAICLMALEEEFKNKQIIQQ